MCKTPKDRERFDNQANLFAIISTIEQLEKAYIRDCITANEYKAVLNYYIINSNINRNFSVKRYTDSCANLLTQFKTAYNIVESEFPRIDDFVKKYKLDFPVAMVRIKEDRPITIKDDNGNSRKLIAQTVSVINFLMKNYCH